MSLGATPSKSFPYFIKSMSCLAIESSLFWLIRTWIWVRMMSNGWVINVDIIPDEIPEINELRPIRLPYSYKEQQRPAKQAYFQQEAAHPLKNPEIPSIEQILLMLSAILPDHFPIPDSQYLAQITHKGLATTVLAMRARDEEIKLTALYFYSSFWKVLNKQKQTELPIPVFKILTTNPLQNDFQPYYTLMQRMARQTFFTKLEDSSSLLGGMINAILMLSSGCRIVTVTVPATEPKYPFLEAITKYKKEVIIIAKHLVKK